MILDDFQADRLRIIHDDAGSRGSGHRARSSAGSPAAGEECRTGRGKHGRMTNRPRYQTIVGGLAVAGAALLAACSSGSSSTSAAAKPHAAVHSGSPASSSSKKAACQHITSLRKSLESLTHTTVSPTSAGTITADLANIQSEVSALKGMGGMMGGSGAMAAHESQLNASVNQIKKAAGMLSSSPSAAMQSLTTELNKLKAMAPAMISHMKTVCP